MMRRLLLPKWTRRQLQVDTASIFTSCTHRRLAQGNSDKLIGNYSSIVAKTESTGPYDYYKAASDKMASLNIHLCQIKRSLSTAPSSGNTRHNEAAWNAKYELLQQYEKDHGDCLVPKSYTTTDEVKLGLWVYTQRQAYKKLQEGKPSSMTQERISELENIGFVWDVQESQWNARYELLQQYLKGHSNSLLPTRYTTKDGVNLGNWVVTQRQHYKKFQEGKPSAMTEQRIEKLESIGFDWDPNDTDWNIAFKKLLEWMNVNKHRLYVDRECTWKTSKGTYGEWAYSQRMAYWDFILGKKEGSKYMTLDRIQKLNTVGFPYDPKKIHQDQAFELLKEFKEMYGHCDVPLNYVSPGGIKFGIWIDTLRSQYYCLNENDCPFLDLADGYIDIYQRMGFKWEK